MLLSQLCTLILGELYEIDVIQLSLIVLFQQGEPFLLGNPEYSNFETVLLQNEVVLPTAQWLLRSLIDQIAQQPGE